MAAIAPTQQSLTYGSMLITWPNMAQNDTGNAVALPRHTDMTIQVFGTFNAASVGIEGSNNGSNFSPLTDPQGNNIAITSAAIEQILQNTVNYQIPDIGGGASTDITVVMLAHTPEWK